MQRFFFLTCCLLVLILFALTGFQPAYPLPATQTEVYTAETFSDDEAIAQALVDIYYTVDVLGLKEVTIEGLENDFAINTDILTAAYGKYSDGRFGIADIIILLPQSGFEEEAREALQIIQTSRITFFKNFDVYDAYNLASQGTIFRQGDYYILTMIADSSSMRTILERYLPS